MSFVQRKIDERAQAKEKGLWHPPSRTTDDGPAPQDFLEKLTEAQKEAPDKVTPYHIFMSKFICTAQM